MPANANGGPGGLVNECVNVNDQSCFSMGAFVDNMGSATQDYSILFAASQTGAPDSRTGQGDATQIGIVIAGTEIRLCDISSDGSVQIVVSIQKAALTPAQQQRVHISFARTPNNRVMYFDAVVAQDQYRTATDSTPMTSSQTTSGVVVNYGVHAPVALGKLQMLGGFITAADAAYMRAGHDVRDVAYQSGGRLSAVFEFPLDHDLTEVTGLYPGFRNNSSNTYAGLLEPDVNASPSFSGNAVPTVAWSGNGAVVPNLTPVMN